MINRQAVRANGRRSMLALMSILWCAALPGLAEAAYPDHPIKLIVPFAAGGVYDTVARPWAEKVGATLGTIVIENRGGGGGSIGAAAGAAAAPDGYTLLLGGAGPNVINPLTSATKPFDTLKDFEPIALVAKAGFAIIVNPDVPARTLAELIAYAKANPGKLSYATAGAGSGNHLTGELFKSLAGLPDIAHVPYKGAGPALSDVLGGHVPIGTPTINPQILALHRAGKLRVLAVTGRKRLQSAPDIPTAEEAGVHGLVAENFLMLFAPRGTPKEIIERVHAANAQALASPELQKIYITGGLEPVTDSDPVSARKFLEGEIARWTPVVQAVGLKK
jgi:tripartite-type tricarboxylate transporter receptor subunit TctC